MANNITKRIRQFRSRKQYIRKNRRTSLPPTFAGLFRERQLLREDSNVSTVDVHFQMYKDVPSIRGAINVVTNAVTSTGYDVKTDKKGDVDIEDERVKNIYDWITHPDREFDTVLRDLTLSLLIFDKTFIETTKHVKTKDEESFGWMFPLDSRYVQIAYDKLNKKVGGVIYQVPGVPDVPLSMDSFVEGSLNKTGSALGLSSLESLVKSADMYLAATSYNLDLFNGNGVPTLAFVMKQGSPEDYDVLQKTVKNTKQGESLTIRGDIEVKSIGSKSSEIGYKDLQDQVVQDVMTVYQIPPTLMSIAGSKSQESAREETSAFAMNVRSVQIIINNIINRAIIRIWGDDYSDLRFELKPWVNEKAQAAIDKIYAGVGVFTPNHILRRMGFPTEDWGDVPYNPNAPLGKGIGELPDDMMALHVQEVNKPVGSQEEAEGGEGEVDRPQRQDKEEQGDQLKQLISVSKGREKYIEALEKLTSKLSNIVELHELSISKIAQDLG